MSTTTLPVIRLQSCPKGYTRDLDILFEWARENLTAF